MSQGGPLSSTGSIPSDVVINITGNTGSGSAVANNFDIVGTGSISTSVVGDTLTISNSASIPAGVADRQVLQSVTGLPPVWSTATYPATTTANQLLVSTATNTVGGLTAGTDGQVLIGSTGAVPQFSSLTSNGGTVTFTQGAGTLNIEAGGKIITTVFDASGTWTKAAGVTQVLVLIWNGGTGGGSGRRGLSTAAGGGGGGANGFGLYWFGLASYFGPTTTVTIGNGGAGGNAVAVDNTNGNAGALGGKSILGNIMPQTSAAGGLGGTTTTAAGSVAQGWRITTLNNPAIVNASGVAGGAGSNVAGTFSAISGGITQLNFVPTGGGGGGGADTVTGRIGGVGGTMTTIDSSVLILGGTAGAIGGTGGSGNIGIQTNGTFTGGTGGGGGGGMQAGTPGAGGVGGIPGGGGGGGGGSLNGTASGAGGIGGAGRIIVIEFS